MESDDIIIAEPVAIPTTTDVFVVMLRFGANYWSAGQSYQTLAQACESGQTATSPGIEAWRIVRVPGLPIRGAAGGV